MGLSLWFIYSLGYDVSDKYQYLRTYNKRIKLDEYAFQSQKEKSEIEIGGETMLKISNFSKKYGKSKTYAVKDVDLQVNGGEIFGFLGPNGAGKSTIIKSIVGIQAISEGSINVCGFDIAHESKQAKMNIGYVPDHYALYEKLTGRQYLNYIADIYKVSKADRDDRINNLLEKLDLKNSFDNPIKTYSHGMKQKIAIMTALIHKPKLWILDEPLTGLDPNSIAQVKEIMKNYAREGNIVFFSSHIIDVVERVCDTIAIIKKGKIKAQIKVSELVNKGVILEEYYMKIIGNEEIV